MRTKYLVFLTAISLVLLLFYVLLSILQGSLSELYPWIETAWLTVCGLYLAVYFFWFVALRQCWRKNHDKDSDAPQSFFSPIQYATLVFTGIYAALVVLGDSRFLAEYEIVFHLLASLIAFLMVGCIWQSSRYVSDLSSHQVPQMKISTLRVFLMVSFVPIFGVKIIQLINSD